MRRTLCTMLGTVLSAALAMAQVPNFGAMPGGQSPSGTTTYGTSPVPGMNRGTSGYGIGNSFAPSAVPTEVPGVGSPGATSYGSYGSYGSSAAPWSSTGGVGSSGTGTTPFSTSSPPGFTAPSYSTPCFVNPPGGTSGTSTSMAGGSTAGGSMAGGTSISSGTASGLRTTPGGTSCAP